jgi:hypothetical protein
VVALTVKVPTDALRAGCEILDPIFVPNGFTFATRDTGRSSGGHFAWGEYVRGERRLALHVRWALGLVTYHFGDVQASHESYVRVVHGISGGNAYPGFSADVLDGFRHLRLDLERYGATFLRGTDEELRSLLVRVDDQEQRRPRGLQALFDPGGAT